jgi:hypothetical protein
VDTEHPKYLSGWESVPDTTEDYDVPPEPEAPYYKALERPFLELSEQERSELYQRVHGAVPGVNPDPEASDVDLGTLDFNRPFPISLSDPKELSARLHDFADECLFRFQVDATFLEVLPIRGYLSEEARGKLDNCLLIFLANIRLAQGKTALYQPVNEVTEYRKYRAIVPAAPALLRLNDWVADTERSIAGLKLGHDLPSVAPGPIEFTLTNGSVVKVPQNFPQVVRNGGASGYISYGLALKLELNSLRQASSRLRDLFGAPDVWVKQPQHATVEGLFRALRARECDYEEFLAELQQALGLPDTTFLRGELARIIFPLGCMKDPDRIPAWKGKRNRELFGYLAGKARKAVREKDAFKHLSLGGQEVHQVSPLDEMTMQLGLFNPSLRWQTRVQWEQIADELDARTAGELRKVLDGATRAEIGEADYKHFQRSLPKIRAVARILPSMDSAQVDPTGRVPELAAYGPDLKVVEWKWPDLDWEKDPAWLRNFNPPVLQESSDGNTSVAPGEESLYQNPIVKYYELRGFRDEDRRPNEHDPVLSWSQENARPVFEPPQRR